ncbi:MAG TPA: S41 family peptidase, partial [Solirubrobacterales bacterium]
EILTAALSDYGLAEVVGGRTYGKGTFQEVIQLENGGALDLTVGEYLTSEDVSLAGKGIKPDVEAEDRPNTKPDEGLDIALEELAGQL